MKKHLNTLFVTTQGSYLFKEGETVVVKAENEVRLRLPVHTIGGIVCFGNVLCSPFLLGFCAENNVAVSFLSENGRFLARVQGPVSGNVLLRRQQYRLADDPESSARIARYVLTGKLANCRAVVQRTLRDHADKVNTNALKAASDNLKNSLQSIQTIQTGPGLDNLRGIEGDAAHTYFSVFDHLIVTQ
ncbi:MAG: CRISPR-associated endonuclease Cas1, partial [Desulfobacteraceae bacterium]